MHLKVHTIPGEGTITALCDAELIGRTLVGEYCDLVIDDDFYGKEPTPQDEIIAALKDAVNANIIGRKSCALAIAIGVIAPDDCMEIEGIPHAQVYRV
ncbi:MAG TPA: DUF424 domain-containing protein [Methanocorpusculum sp.]|nr:DUF424 domain-containing protein [Methanocorpusculum sp.]